MSGGLRSQGVAVSMGGSTSYQSLLAPIDITDFSTQPSHVKRRIGRPSGLGTQEVTFAAGGCTMSLLDVGSSSYEDYANGAYLGCGLVMPCSPRSFEATAVFDNLTNMNASGFPTQLHMTWQSPSSDKLVNSCRFSVVWELTNAASNVFKSVSGTNGSHSTHGSTAVGALPTTMALRLALDEGKRCRAYFSKDGGAYTEVDATWRQPSNTMDTMGQPFGSIGIGLGNSNGNAGGIAARLTSWTFTGVVW